MPHGDQRIRDHQNEIKNKKDKKSTLLELDKSSSNQEKKTSSSEKTRRDHLKFNTNSMKDGGLKDKTKTYIKEKGIDYEK